jgi:hypothetical protein
LLQTGSRWTARQNEWNEKVDRMLEDQAKEIGQIQKRLRELEGSEQMERTQE